METIREVNVTRVVNSARDFYFVLVFIKVVLYICVMLKDQLLDKGIEDAFITTLAYVLRFRKIVKSPIGDIWPSYEVGGIYISESGIFEYFGYKFRLSPGSQDKAIKAVKEQFALQQIRESEEAEERFLDFLGIRKGDWRLKTKEK